MRGNSSTEKEARSIGEPDPREIAGMWHGGKSTPLYIFSSTGTVLDEVVDEIEARLKVAAPYEAADLWGLFEHVVIDRLNPLGWKVAHPHYRSEVRYG